MLSAYAMYALYIPSKLHFTSNYDIFNYEKRVKGISVDQFEKRKDRNEFEKWARICQSKERASGMCVANFAYSNDNWLYEPKEEAIEIYQVWRKNRASITKTVTDDHILLSSFMEGENPKISKWNDFLVKTKNGNKPPLLQLIAANKISRETVCILDRADLICINDWMESYASDPLLSQMIFRLIKYKPFCNNLCPTVSDIFKEYVTQNER